MNRYRQEYKPYQMKKWSISKKKQYLFSFLLGLFIVVTHVWALVDAISLKENQNIVIRGLITIIFTGWAIDYFIKYRKEIRKAEL